MTMLDPTEAARLLRMTPDTLLRKARAGKIPGAKVGRSWLFIEADLLAMIRTQATERAYRAHSLTSQ